MKSVKIVFVTLMQDELNRVNYMDYISISDEKSTSQHAIIKPKQFLKCTDTIVACRTGAIFSHFSGAVGEECVHGSRRASFCSPEKKKNAKR